MFASEQECKETAEALEKYVDMHPAFENAREFKFLKVRCSFCDLIALISCWAVFCVQSLLEAFQKDDLDSFTDIVAKFDAVIKLVNAAQCRAWISE